MAYYTEILVNILVSVAGTYDQIPELHNMENAQFNQVRNESQNYRLLFSDALSNCICKMGGRTFFFFFGIQ